MHGPLVQILVILALGMPVVLLAQRLRISALIAYLATGALVGPYGLFKLVGENELATFAEIGAALLLFSLGLELDLNAMRKQMRALVVGTLGQMGLTIAVGTLVVWLAGLPWSSAFAVGCCMAMSSTLMVLRALDEQRLRHRPEGRTVIGLLLAQDLMLAPLLVLLSYATPAVNRQSGWTAPLGMLVCLGTVILVRKVLGTRLFSRIRAARLPELEVAFSVTVALGAAAATQAAGLGAAVGAFCAGLALGGEEHRGAIGASTRPLQGLMAILFFISVGVMFNGRILFSAPLEVLGGLVVSIGIKAALAGFALRMAGLSVRSAIGCGIMTGQIGEFSFVLAAAAFGGSTDPAIIHLYQLMVVVTCLSLALTPLLVSIATRFLPQTVLEALKKSGDAIVVAGLGPVGNEVVQTLHQRGCPLLLVDRNPRLLAAWKDTANVRLHQGRIEDMEDWLPVLGHRPAAVILTFPIADTSAVVAERLRTIDPELMVIARSPYESQIGLLRNAGVQHVICDERATAAALLPLLDLALGNRFKRSETVNLASPS